MTDTVNEVDTDTTGPIAEFLHARLGVAVPADQDLFADGLVSSMFAMELIVHLESTFAIAITGSDLRLANFRTIGSMAALVTRLRAEPGHG